MDISQRVLLTLCCAAVLARVATAQECAREVGLIRHSSPAPVAGGCGTLFLNSDATYENGYAWSYGGVFAPDWGAFAECYPATDAICALVFDLTQLEQRPGSTMDVFVWSDDGGIPGAVLCMVSAVNPGPVAMWPAVSRHVVSLGTACCVSEFAWVGYWGAWQGDVPSWYIGADLDGPGGCPMTHVHPGIGFPSGWQDVSDIWGPTQALGLGLESVQCLPVPIAGPSWGGVKALYR